MTHEYVYML